MEQNQILVSIRGWEDKRTAVQKPEERERESSEPSSASELKKEKTPFEGKYESYTPLALPRTKIYSITKDEQKYKKLRPLPLWHQQKNKDRWCKFHESPGHHTEDCIQVRDQIEDMVRKGYLKKYLADRCEVKKAEKDSQQELDFPRKKDKLQDKDNPDILVISGGTSSRKARKRHLRGLTHQVNRAPQSLVPNFTFTIEDFRGVVYPQDDPLVIVTGIANHNV
ncbi:uncharacterized protein LOC110739099 [Chenopodium quinoa]|uniref:uncharacterized protein LOC110739099 n=1 Tax=Chenopodium quinoa TaxID=63459 RepID=UPI000B78670C|nr:uncharacterized protein LOC110739099 [Chenopodium quinoa]